MTIAATQTWRVATFDKVVEQFSTSLVSFTEDEALKSSHWDLGEDARLREDARFRPTPWGRWILASHLLANDLLVRQLRQSNRAEISLSEALENLQKANGCLFMFCTEDPRFVTEHGMVRLGVAKPGGYSKDPVHLPDGETAEPTGGWSTKNGKRDINTQEGQNKVADRLIKAIQQFFDGTSSALDEEEKPSKEVEWSARFICLEANDGGLCIEAGPLAGLPPFAKKLQIVSGTESRTVLASNFRTKSWRVEVMPSTEPYSWTAPGFEEDLDESLKILELAGFSADSAIPFRIDASGVGQILSGATLSPGQSYRLLVPPALDTVQLPDDGKSSSIGSWRLWELKVAAEPDQVFKELLQRLGLSLGKSTPELFWVGAPAACYRSTSSGETYPCFASSCPPLLAIQGIVAESDGEVMIFLSDKETTQTLSLPKGDSWCVELSDLVPGNYMVEVLHESISVEPGRLPFALAEVPHPRLDAKITASIAGTQYEITGAGSLSIPYDFSLLEEESMLVIKGPPLWPVTITWECGRPRRLALNALGKDGSLDTPFLSSLTEEPRSRCRLANLAMDFKELGKFILQFEQPADPEALTKSIQLLLQDRAQTAKNLAGQFPLLRSLFLDPFLHLLQYTIGEVERDVLETASPGATVLLLLETTRTPQGEVREVPRRVLLLANSLLDLPSSTESSLRSLAERLCWQCGVVEALVTDGLRWHLHKRGSKLRWQRWDLLALSVEPESFDWDGFLTNCAVGV